MRVLAQCACGTRVRSSKSPPATTRTYAFRSCIHGTHARHGYQSSRSIHRWSVEGRWRAPDRIPYRGHTGVQVGGPVLCQPLARTTNRASRRNWKASGELRADGHRVASAAAPHVAIRSGLQQGSPGDGKRILFRRIFLPCCPATYMVGRIVVTWHGRARSFHMPVSTSSGPRSPQAGCEDGKG